MSDHWSHKYDLDAGGNVASPTQIPTNQNILELDFHDVGL